MDRFIIELMKEYSWNVCWFNNLNPQLIFGILSILVETGLAVTRRLKHGLGHPPAVAAGFKIMTDGILGSVRDAHRLLFPLSGNIMIYGHFVVEGFLCFMAI